jgi:hypothetical protein
MSNPFNETLHTAWATECMASFGRVLPINHISLGTLEHRLDSGEDPLVSMSGEVARTFRLHYDYGRIPNESIN